MMDTRIRTMDYLLLAPMNLILRDLELISDDSLREKV